MKKCLVALAALALAAALYAQDVPQAGALGITGSVGTSLPTIGGWYNATPNIAIRPFIGFSTSSSPDNPGKPDLTDFTFALGADLLYQLPIAGNFVLGVGPGFKYSHETVEYSESDTVGGSKVSYDYTNTTSYFTLLAKASTQYYFSKNFCAYLDLSLGLEFANIDNDEEIKYPTSSIDNDTSYKTTSFGTYTAALGVAYFFK
jgi:opacity protein-like surface antigen